MQNSKHASRWLRITALFAGLLCAARITLGQVAPSEPELPDLDRRAKGAVLSPAHETALAQLRTRIPTVRIDTDEVLGSPAWVYSSQGFLTGPASEDEIVPRTVQAAMRPVNADPYRPIRLFLNQNAALFGHGSEVLTNNAKIKDEYVTSHNGMRTIVWEQQLDGIPVFEGLLIGHITRNGELVNLSSHFLPNVQTASQMDATQRAAVEANPLISSQQAVANAATNIGETLRAEDVSAVSAVLEAADKRQNFTAPPLVGEAQARLVWLPMSSTSIRLCWSVELVGRGRVEMYRVLIDAQTGEPLVRHCLTAYQSQAASFRVFTSDSPSSFSPGHPMPSSVQPPLLGPPPLHGRQMVTVFPSPTSPNGWIDDGDNETRGNNIDAHLDRDANNLPDLPRPNGGTVPGRVFEFDLDLGQGPTVEQTGAFNQSVAVVNLFYWCNLMHDWLYEFGFTEAARNFQNNNFGRGGLGNDAVQADAQDGSGVNNANFSTPPDGTPGRMQMYIFNGPDPDRDGDLDAEVILHEYTHGLSNRRVGGGVGITALQSRGLGEGWSDFYALALLSEETDDIHAKYAMGGYVTYLLGGTFTVNYYFGIRRYPYTTDMGEIDPHNFNPLTFRDIDPNAVPPRPSTDPDGDGYPPRSPIIGNGATSYHNMGEVWCSALWDARVFLIDRHGYSTGNDLILRLVTDGMNLSPANPTFIQARDAILQADRVYTGGANLNELWAAFARRGMGWGATTPPSTTTIGVVESFALPPQGNQLWSYTTGNAIYSSPAIGPDGTVYVGSDDGRLYAFYPDTGVKKWEFYEPWSPPQSFRSAPIPTSDGTIYARRSNGYLYAINSDGTLKWKVWISYDSYVSAALGPDGTIYVAGFTDLKAISPQGTILWTFPTGNTIYSSPAIAPDGTIYFGGMDTKVYAVDPNTHQVKSGWPVVTGGYVASSPAIGRDGTVYVGASDGKLYAMNPNGTFKWPPVALGSGGIDSSPAIGPDGSVYVGSWDYRVYSVNPHTGQINPGWPFVTGHYVRSSPAVAADGTIFIGSYDGRLYAVNPDGTAVGAPWPFYTGGAVFSSPVIGANGTVYVGSGNRKLYALSGLSGLARSPWPMFRHSPWHTGNPSTLTLSSGVRLQDLDFQFQIHGLSGMNCTVEGSHNLESWATLGSVTLPAGGVATFTDTQASGYAYRFYRVRSDSILSYNSLGYVAVEVPVGYSMIANQLDHPAGNAVGVLLPDSPEGTMLYKWDEGAQQFVINEFVSGVWEEPYMTLNPGEGALVQPGTATVFTFVGDLRQGTLANPYPSTFSIRSSLVPQSGPLDTGLGFQPAQGDRIDRWNNAIGDYELYTFFAGTWHPTVPIPRVGESFWISGTGNTWTRTFSIW